MPEDLARARDAAAPASTRPAATAALPGRAAPVGWPEPAARPTTTGTRPATANANAAPPARPARPTDGAPPLGPRPATAPAPAATAGATAWASTRPADLRPSSRPAEPAFPSTRPAELPFPNTRLAELPFQTTRPADPFASTRPSELAGAAPRPRPAPPPAPVPTPAQPGDWQLAGRAGQHLVLMPGQMHLGRHAASVRTLLGSCVAITLWHPALRIGGMCHYLLPQRQRRPGEAPDGRYGDEAVEAMVQRLRALGAQPGDFIAHLYGGADTLSASGGGTRFNIGERNIEQGWTLIDRYGFQLDGVDVGEDVPRVVALSLTDGAVQMRRGSGRAPDHLRG